MLFICYPKCSTCKKAKKHLDELMCDYTQRDISIDNPNEKELTNWIKVSGLDIKKLFNTSGKLYKELGLARKLDEMSFEEKIKLLSSNGMLVKRPILVVNESKVLVGYKKQEYDKIKEL